MLSKFVAVVGLGYVGLPLAIEFGKKYKTVGFDVSLEKIKNYQNGVDTMGEVSKDEFKSSQHLSFSADPASLKQADVIIVTVPTPVDQANKPDLSLIRSACESVGQNMKKGVIVVFESTVYPGLTEEVCVPLLEKISGFKWKTDFHVGYSPERVNPGDSMRKIPNITKVVAGDSAETTDVLGDVYGSIIPAGIYKASSIKVAEAAKVIENTQRDLNIALVNELSFIFNRMDIDTTEVLEAAGTKWNFLPFRPGLVGGHCIGVDPYYLTHKAEMIGYHPQVILAGRRINDGMAKFVAEQTIKHLIHSGKSVKGSQVIILGLTFKEGCRDIRNSKVSDVVAELEEYGCKVYVHDPLADPEAVKHEYGIDLVSWEALPRNVDAVVAAVSHSYYMEKSLEDVLGFLKPKGLFVDVKSAYDKAKITSQGYEVWRL